MDVKNLIKKLRENRAEISLNKYVDNLYEGIKTLEFIEKCATQAIKEGKTCFSVNDYNSIKMCEKIFGLMNVEQYSYGSGMDWHCVTITELGLRKLDRKLKKIYKKAGKKYGDDSSGSDKN